MPLLRRPDEHIDFKLNGFEEDRMSTCDFKQNGAGVDVGSVAQGPYSVNAGSRSYVRNGSAMGAERPE